MSQTKNRPFLWPGKTLPLILPVCLFICSSSLYLLILLPSLLTLESVETMIENYSGKLLNAPLEIDDMACSWSEGLRISGLKIQGRQPTDPESILHIDDFRFHISFADIFHGRIDFRLFLKGFALNLIRHADGRTNIDGMIASQDKTPVSRQSEEAKPETPETDNQPFHLPLDVGGRVEWRDIAISINDQVTGKHLQMDKGFLILDAPSIRFQEIGLKLHMDIAVNHRPLPPVDLLLTAAHILDPETGAATPEKIHISIEGKFPGTTLTVDGGLFGQGLRSDVHVDLKALHVAASPFLPIPVASSGITGFLDISTNLQMKSNEIVSFDSAVKLDHMNLSGPLIRDREIRDFHVSLLNTGSIDLTGKKVDLSKGKLTILQGTEFLYHAVLDGNNTAAQDSFFSLDKASIHIDELLKFGESFLPLDFPVILGGETQPSVMQITDAILKGNFSTGDCTGKIGRLHLNIPMIRVKDKNANIRIHNTQFDLAQLTADLKQYFPLDIRFDSLLHIDHVAVDTKETILVHDISVPKFQFRITDIRKNPKALFGYAANLSGIQNLLIQKIRIPSMGEVSLVRQKLDGFCRLLPEKKVLVGIREIHIGASDLMIQNDAVGLFQTGLDINGSLSELNIYGLKPIRLDITGFQNKVKVGDFAQLHMTTDIRDTADREALAKGELMINLGNLFQRLSQKPKQILFIDGTARMRWDIHARRPSPSEITHLQNSSFADLQKDFPFIHNIHTDFTLNHIHADISIRPDVSFQLEDVSAEPFFQYDYDGKKGKGSYAGNLSFHNIKSTTIPDIHQPVSADFSFSGTHDNLNGLSLSQDFEIVSMGVKESMLLTLSGLDQSILRNRELNLPYFLKKTGGSFSGKITVTDMAILNQLLQGVSAEGSLSAGLSLLLVPGSSLGGKTWVQLSDVVLEKDQAFSIQELSGDIRLEKEYLLTENITNRKEEGDRDSIDNLSDRVLTRSGIQGKPSPAGFSVAGGKYQYPLQTLQTGYQNQEMMIRFTSAGSEKGPLPMTLRHFQAGLELVEGLPRIHGFQVDLLGGTIVSSLSIQQIEKRFFIPVMVSFSGIQTDRFWGKAVTGEQKKDTEVSGQVYAYFPVTTDIHEFLNDLNVDMLFTHIGNMALEQLLYSLDPTESNEKIVSQRKLVQKGSPKWMRLTIMDGALSLEGVVSVQGVDIDIPQVKRLNISGLSGLDPLERGLLKLSPVVGILRSMSANAIWMDRENNTIGFIQ
ncbi:MAG: hypothetical protein ABIK15_08685 [Pseudomonadota bacterium]